MTYGLQVRDASNVTTFDSTLAVGGCVAGVVAGLATAQAYTFPAFSGRSAFAVALNNPYAPAAVVDTALGYPRVTTPAFPGTTVHYTVFIV